MSIKVIKPFLFNTNLVFDSKDTIIRNLKTKIVILENRIKQLESLIENKRKLTRANSYTKHQSNNLILTNFKSVKLINPQELLNNIDISPNNNSQSPHKTKMRLQKYRNLSLHNIKHNTNVSSESTSISGVVVNNNNNNNNTHNKTRNKFKCEVIPRLPKNIRIVGNNTVNNKNGYLTPSYTDGGSGKKMKGKINCGDKSCDDGKGSVVNERDDGCRSMVKCFTVGNNTPRKKVFSKGRVKGFGRNDLNLNKNMISHNNSEGSSKQQYVGVNMQLKCIKERTRKLLTQLISMNYNCKCACK